MNSKIKAALIVSGFISIILFQNAEFSSTPVNQSPEASSFCAANPKALRLLKKSIDQSFQGFGCNSLGGLGGFECEVSSVEDNPSDPQSGTLRYCLEKRFEAREKNSAVNITFSSAISGKEIKIKAPIYVRSATTLDGRMASGYKSPVLTNDIYAVKNPCVPSYAKLYDPELVEQLCGDDGNPGFKTLADGSIPLLVWNTNLGAISHLLLVKDQEKVNGVLVQKAVTDVIITDVVMKGNIPPRLPRGLHDVVGKSNFTNPCYESNTAATAKDPSDVFLKKGPRFSKGCPVMIKMGDDNPAEVNRVENIVIANSDFSFCGEKCLIGQATTDKVTIVRNHFHDSYFSTLMLMSSRYNLSPDGNVPPDNKDGFIPVPSSRYTFYNNHFERVIRRNPRCASYVWCHIYGNVIEDWGISKLSGFGISAVSGAKIVAEWNFFNPNQDFSSSNPAIASDNNDLNPNKSRREDPVVYLGKWALLQDNKIKYPTTAGAVLYQDALGASLTKPFDPHDYYRYSTPGLSADTYKWIKENVGPRIKPGS